MAAPSHQHSLVLERSTCHHYYHCVLYDILFDLPVREIAAQVVPCKDSNIVQRLTSADCRVVPHQLHVYKEPLEKKFGYVSFFVHRAPHSSTAADDVHRLVCEWVAVDLASQLATVQCKVQLAQPPECHSSEPFLNAFRLKCPLLDPTLAADTKKLETFVLTRVRFGQHCGNASVNQLNAVHCDDAKSAASAGSCGTETEMCTDDGLTATEGELDAGARSATRTLHEHVWKCVGTFLIASLSPKELVWLKKQLPSFPPLRIANGDMDTAYCDEAKLAQFFETSLAPLFTVDEVVEAAALNTVNSEA
ncbi:conserved hypothetical protein [Leishmania major strain Friedlin]|uniref:Uncharacterized protein n=1 Tax=Leishmania major TaxID=5664 RepID=Q4Q5G7_LEIMA|nr:conserved hypothetical protein [Leishmania major strain Friedlin]CAG9580159.1 hypothetical_protein_-_conserved [Leishmania major strain Friedlin]CAJ08635.1 conserved hypothetical protein [Leishmania major strain Friedlin]|eukprot:XP_001685431.1 conserved hypothetical protein [Leishmania major strain Friedlin]